MQFKPAVHISKLEVGDIVRFVNGHFSRAGDIPPVLGGAEDFRWAFDCMIVYRVTDTQVSFKRPYMWLDPKTNLMMEGVEAIDNFTRSNNYWFELLRKAGE